MTRHSVHIKIDGRTYAGSYAVDREFSRSAQATARRPPKWATKSRMRPLLISSCRNWCKRKRAARALGSKQWLLRTPRVGS